MQMGEFCVERSRTRGLGEKGSGVARRHWEVAVQGPLWRKMGGRVGRDLIVGCSHHGKWGGGQGGRERARGGTAKRKEDLRKLCHNTSITPPPDEALGSTHSSLGMTDKRWQGRSCLRLKN